jgi:8-hydroxy-5-deazaflavin:NADPH oxidoreductase
MQNHLRQRRYVQRFIFPDHFRSHLMKIGIIGAGNVGTGIGKHLAAKAHNILVSFARTPEKVAEAAAVIGNGARAGTVEEAARHGDVVIVATPWGVTLEAVAPIAAMLVGKVVWDTTNPFKPTMDELFIGTNTSAGEEIARELSGANVVKAVPPFAQLLHSPSMLIGGRKPGVFVCGDNADARKMVFGLVQDIDADPVDAGPLKMARFTEPLGMLVTNLAYVKGLGVRTSAVLIHESQ